MDRRTIKVARLWSKGGPTHARRNGWADEEDQSHVCTIRVPETVEVEDAQRIVLDEIRGKILLFSRKSVTVLSFV